MADNTGTTIIIKKIKKGGHGHHGGAWKVAYADFVTAMMAFFLLMWLLNASEAESLAGLADYFAPTIGIKGEMGIGFRGGKNALSEGIGADKSSNRGIFFGGVPTGPIIKVPEKFDQLTEENDSEIVSVTIGENKLSEPTEIERAAAEYIREISEETGKTIEVTQRPEGLEIQIRDSNNRPMFKRDSSILLPRMKESLLKLTEILITLPNQISITGHTSYNQVYTKKNYTSWELSADRANATRRFLLKSGMQPEQIASIIGKADNDLFDSNHPKASVNNRITLTLLRKSVIPQHKKATPKKLYLDTGGEKILTKEDKENDKIKEEQIKNEAVKKAAEIEKTKEIVESAEEEEGEIERDFLKVTDPFSGKNGLSMKNLLGIGEEHEKMIEKPKPIRADLLEEIQDDNFEKYEAIKVQDPFSGGIETIIPKVD